MAVDARTAVLEAAAELFDTRGFGAVSIAGLTEVSGVSNGSIYHHFGSKDGVLAALVVDALGDYQDGLLAVFGDDPRAGIAAAIAYELGWFETHAREARLVIAHRDAVAAGDAGRERLRAINREFLGAVRAWLDRFDATRELDLAVVHAIAFAPAREIGAQWLARRVRARPSTFASALGDAAWAGLQALELSRTS